MCEPVSISTGAMYAMGALAVAGAAASVYSYQQQKKSLNEMAAMQQDQINDQASQKTQERMEEARALRAQARASAAEAGVGGTSVDLLLGDITAQAGKDVAIVKKNADNGIVASSAETAARMRGASAEMVGGVVGSASNFYSSYSRYSIPQSTPTTNGG